MKYSDIKVGNTFAYKTHTELLRNVFDYDKNCYLSSHFNCKGYSIWIVNIDKKGINGFHNRIEQGQLVEEKQSSGKWRLHPEKMLVFSYRKNDLQRIYKYEGIFQLSETFDKQRIYKKILR